MEWSLISLIIGFDPIYSKMKPLKRVQGVLKMIFQGVKNLEFKFFLNFAKNYQLIEFL